LQIHEFNLLNSEQILQLRRRKKEEGRRKEEEGRRKEEGGRRKEEVEGKRYYRF
jgi:hypothetical protein